MILSSVFTREFSMEGNKIVDSTAYPFPTPPNRFDQKNEMFKRSVWDETMRLHAKGFYEEVVFLEKVGYRKQDYALRNAAWNLEWGFALGNSRSNFALYAWEGVAPKIKRYVDAGEQVKTFPEEMSLTVKKAARVRLCKVFTDLPLQPDSYHPIGSMEFCRTCNKCAYHCPSRAIPLGEMTTEGPNISNQSGIPKWYVDAEKCFAFWGKNHMDCSNCIRVCPYNKMPGFIHTAVRFAIRHKPRPAKDFW
jgi:ferredoxin